MKQQQQREQEVRLRAELIAQVRGGTLTAAAAARRLGVSRKTYYKWERRALAGMMGALGERSGGRPAAPPDEEKERLRREVGQLRRKLLLAEQRLAIQKVLRQETENQSGGGRGERAKKKGRTSSDDR
jgi:transposase